MQKILKHSQKMFFRPIQDLQKNETMTYVSLGTAARFLKTQRWEMLKREKNRSIQCTNIDGMPYIPENLLLYYFLSDIKKKKDYAKIYQIALLDDLYTYEDTKSHIKIKGKIRKNSESVIFTSVVLEEFTRQNVKKNYAFRREGIGNEELLNDYIWIKEILQRDNIRIFYYEKLNCVTIGKWKMEDVHFDKWIEIKTRFTNCLDLNHFFRNISYL